ncbi:MAG: hypothetical protein Kow0069_03200 [Promethearchaeota archaeon]
MGDARAPAAPIDSRALGFALLGFLVSMLDQWVIQGSMEVWAYLLIIFLIIIPGVGVGLVRRVDGYAYVLGFLVGGLMGAFTIDPFIGWTTFVSAALIFTIIWLVFWRIWRSIAWVRVGEDRETRPVEKD